jgi:dTDP-4-dehydrorhamnose reductase
LASGRNRKALILGASGQVGQALARELEGRGWDWQGSFHEHAEVDPRLFRLDLSDLPSLRREVLARTPGAVFLPSGWTWVDGCEDDPARAFLINARAAEAAAEAAALLNCALVYYSTEYVFGESGGPYDELRATAPLGAYGASKLEGEHRVLDAWAGALVLRTTVVYGPEPQEKNFVYQLLKQLRAGHALKAPQDQISSPTYNRDLARASVDLVERGLQGLWNVAGSSVMDRYSFARLAAQTFGLDTGLVIPVRTAELHQKARRPLGAGLLVGKLVKTLGWAPSGPEEGLKRMAAEINTEG